MYCPKCGQPVPESARFCGKCGAQITADTSASQPERSTAGAAGFASAMAGSAAAAAAPLPGTGTQLSGLLERIKNILFSPRTEWPVIEAEPTSIAQLYSSYVVPLAVFAAAVSLIRMSVVGISVPFGGTIRTPLMSGLMYAATTFGFGLLGLFLVGLIINALAPAFSGERNLRQALKTAAYAFTPAWIGTVLTFLPLSTLLQLLMGIYGIYLLYLGLPVLMRSKRERAGGYTATVVLCTILLGVLFGLLSAAFGGAGRLSAFGGSHAGTVNPQSPTAAADRGAATLGNVIGGALGTDEKGKAGLGQALANLARSGEQIEQQQAASAAAATTQPGGAPGAAGGSASASGSASGADPAQNAMAAAGGLLTALGGALGGSHRVNPVDFNTLKAMLPESLPQMRRTGAQGSSQQAMGVKGTSATADYEGPAGSRVRIKIADISGVTGLMDAASALVPTGETESDTGYEKDTVLDGRQVHEKYDRNSGQGDVEAIIAKRFEVDVAGQGVQMEQLEQTLARVDLARLEAMRAAGAIKN